MGKIATGHCLSCGLGMTPESDFPGAKMMMTRRNLRFQGNQAIQAVPQDRQDAFVQSAVSPQELHHESLR